MIDVTTDMLILVLAISCAAEPELSRPGNRARWAWLAVLILGLAVVLASTFWGWRLMVPGGKTLESVLLGAIFLLFGIGLVRYVRRDAARFRARRAGP